MSSRWTVLTAHRASTQSPSLPTARRYFVAVARGWGCGTVWRLTSRCVAPRCQFFTNSANKQCKLWNTESKECVATFTLGKTRERMQVGGVLTASGTGVTLSKVRHCFAAVLSGGGGGNSGMHSRLQDGSLAFLSMDTPDAEPVFYGTLKVCGVSHGWNPAAMLTARCCFVSGRTHGHVNQPRWQGVRHLR